MNKKYLSLKENRTDKNLWKRNRDQVHVLMSALERMRSSFAGDYQSENNEYSKHLNFISQFEGKRSSKFLFSDSSEEEDLYCKFSRSPCWVLFHVFYWEARRPLERTCNCFSCGVPAPRRSWLSFRWMECFLLVDLASCNAAVRCSCEACGGFGAPGGFLTAAFVRWKRFGETDSSGFLSSFIVSSALRLLQWAKLIMSSARCLTPPPFYRDHHTWRS